MVMVFVVVDAHGVPRSIGAMIGVLINATSSESGGLLIRLNSSAAVSGRKRAVTNLWTATTTTTTSTSASAETATSGESTGGCVVASRGEADRKH